MSVRKKSSSSAKEIRWRITRLKGTPAAFLGFVYAADEKTALDKAIAEFRVGPELANRLIARRET